MPSITNVDAVVKRKRSVKSEAPRKRTRPEADEEIIAQERILQLEGQILQSKKHYNNIVELIEIAKGIEAEESGKAGDEDADEDDDDSHGPAMMAAVSLGRVFLRLFAAGTMTVTRQTSEKEQVVVRWLKDRLAEYQLILSTFFRISGDAASTALTLSMRLLQAEGDELRKKYVAEAKTTGKEISGNAFVFPQVLLNSVVRGLLLAAKELGDGDIAESLADEFVEKYAGEFCDVQFYTFKAVSTVLAETASQGTETAAAAASSALYLLSLLDDVPTSSEEFESFFLNPPPPKRTHILYSVSKHRKQAQDAWLIILQRAAAASTASDRDLRKKALGVTSTVIAPWFTQPELMLDFLTDCYDAGGSTSLLALSGLYYLIRERNVDYPAFYTKLYSLLDADLLHSKHRSRFFRLMDTFLASTHLPVQMVASFIKRLARLCLNATPSAVVSVVPWIYNMFKAHPLCTFMIHRVPRTREERDLLNEEGLADPFQADESNPMETQAIDSCLWEIVQLQSHYHPNVATIAKIISEQFTKQNYNVEDFLDHSYQSMFEAEIGKDVRRAPVVEFHIPKRVLIPYGPDAETEDKLLVNLWDFA